MYAYERSKPSTVRMYCVKVCMMFCFSVCTVCTRITLARICGMSKEECDILYTFKSVFSALAQQAVKEGRSPVIIDNTNLEIWEMKPYAEMVSFNITPRLYLSLHLYKLYILSLFIRVHQVTASYSY